MNGRMASWAFFLTSALKSSTFAYKSGKYYNNWSVGLDLGGNVGSLSVRHAQSYNNNNSNNNRNKKNLEAVH